MNKEIKLTLIAILSLGVLVISWMYFYPKYRIYKQDLRGQAELREAQWTKKVQVEQAKSALEAAEYDKATAIKRAEGTNAKAIEEAKGFAEAESIRARGVAEANATIGDSLKGNEAYLRYLFIQGLHDGSSETIYVPTEANLPILESNPNFRGNQE